MNIKLAIIGPQVIDGLADVALPAGAVLIGMDGRIVAAGPQQTLAIPSDVPVLDASGMTLLPGLIDGHQHLAWDKLLYAAKSQAQFAAQPHDVERQLVRAGNYAQHALAAGVTTLRDCAADDYSILALRDMIDSGNFVGPRILACGRAITTTAGHVYTDWGVDSADELKKAVRLLASKGVDFIKVLVSGGTTTPGTNITRAQYTMDELRTVVDDAHRLGLQVAAHAISTDSIRLCAEAGVDTIEHCSWIGSDPKTITPDKEAVALMVKNGVRVDHAIIPRPNLFPDENPSATSVENQWWLDMLKVRWPFLHYMREQGVTVFLGTDAAHGPWPGTQFWPGFQDFARAIEIMVRWAGFSPLQAIKLATSEAARALRLDGEVGAITPGRRADLVLLAKDPLADVRALRQVEMVWRDGNLAANQGQIVLLGSRPEGVALRGWQLPR
jgi:imidazolonepropionase-like amidohydrolase